MVSTESSAGNVPVDRAELFTQDMEMIAHVTSKLYFEHRARFHCADPGRVDGSMRSATVEGLSACLARYSGFEYDADMDPHTGPHAAVVLEGDGVISSPRGELHFTGGDTFLPPPDLSHATKMYDIGFALVQIPWAVISGLAQELTGLPAANLRFESMSPVSAALQATWSRRASFICHELIISGATEVSPLVVEEMTRAAAAAMLETFPNNTMTVAYTPGPGWVPAAAVRQAAAFIDAHADQPITQAQIAAAAGETSRALQNAFHRDHDTTPTEYLRRVRLERAHQELRDAEPGSDVSIAAVARKWGWANLAQFVVAYQQLYGQLPNQTLRT
jgi:AraC-like DNA-binding protein